MRMDVSDAIARAKNWLTKIMEGEGVTNLGLEEVSFDEDTGCWLITLGFSRPWNSTRAAFTAISGEPAPRRAFRTVSVRDSDGAIVAMAKRSEE
jgi:hypothetical protein